MSVEDRLNSLETKLDEVLKIFKESKQIRMIEQIHTIELHACEYDKSLTELIQMLEIPNDIIEQHIQATRNNKEACGTYASVSDLGIMSYRIENLVNENCTYFMGNPYDRYTVKCIIQKK